MKTAFLYIVTLFALLLGLFSCAPKAIVISPPVTPELVRARAAVEAGNASAARLEKKVESIHRSAVGIAAEVDLALATAHLLRVRGSATPDELAAQWQALSSIQNHQRSLVGETDAASQNAAEQRFLREEANQRLTIAESASVTKDKEAEELRIENVKQLDDAAVGRGAKSTGWLLVFMAAAFVVLYLISRVRP